MTSLRCVLFDLDGTLITSYMDNADKDYHNWETYPDSRAVIDALRTQHIHVGIITNQAGVGFGYVSEAEWEAKRDLACQALNVPPAHVWVCFAHPKAKPPYNELGACLRRKPNAAMLKEAMNYFGVATDQTVYVGDMDSDEEAARHAHVAYVNDLEFFGRTLDVLPLPEEAAKRINWQVTA